MTVRGSIFFIAGAAAALFFSTEMAEAQCATGTGTFLSTGGTISASNSDTGTQPVAATNGNPSAITVPNTVTGTVATISVCLGGLTASATGQGGEDEGVSALGILLVHKATGKNLELMYSPGDANVGFSNVTFNISDTAAAGYMPTNGDNCPTSTSSPVAFPSQTTYTYRPSSFESDNALNTYPGATSLPINRSGPCFQTTLNTLNEVFDGVTAAGEWDLYVNSNIGFVDVTISNWTLILTTANAASTTTTLTSSVNPSFTASPNNSTTLTADVTSGVNAGTVAFSDGSTVISGCGAQAVNASGIATCTTSFTTQGFHSLSAAYSGTSTFAPSTGTLNQFVEFHPNVTGTQYCNTGAVGIPNANASGADTQPYPSVMNVTGISQSVSTVQLVLNGVSMSETLDISMLLVSPDGNHALDFFDFVGGGAATNSTSVTFSDGASGLAPMGSGGLAAGTPSYQPTSYRSSPSFLDPPAPAPQVPATFGNAATGGGTSAKTFLEAFNGATANGPWSLYVYDHGEPNTTTISGGWCLSITPGVGLSTTTAVSGSPNGPAPNGAATGATVTITAAVKNGSTPVTTGSVTFTENGQPILGATPSGAINVATSGPTQGQASFTTNMLTEGDHTILATFTDSSNTYSESFGTFVQRVDNTPTVTVNGTTVSYCNTGKITVPNPENSSDLGAGFPNPSNINIGSMFGTIKSVSVSMNGYSEGEPEFLTSVLVGPAANTGATLDFFSRAGGPNSSGTLNLVLSDAGGSLAPQSALSSGTFKPTSYNPMLTADTYTPTISGFYALPATYNYAPTFGTSTFASVFQGTSPNGNWDLYFNQTGDNPGGGLATGWCLNFTANPPALTIGKTHTGNFVQGQQGAQFAITVTNSGPGSAGGAIPVTVTDAMPVGLTPVSGSGTGWNCPAPSGQTITCTNANVVASGDSYPTLTLNVNVATGAPASVSNTASVNGSGNTVAVTSLADTVTILPPPALSISKAPSGTFTQGQTAIWDITVSNKAGSNPTSGTVTVVDTLPNGYTFASNTGTGWTCGAVTVTVTCTSTTALAGGASFPALAITVNVPANSPISVTNNAAAFGGGDPAHTSLGTAVTATSPVTVTQVPATINITAGNNQSVTIGSALPVNLAVTVLDADGVAINGATVTFTAPATGASGTFAGGTNVKTATTNSAGLATATVFTTNFVAGSYSISAAAGSISKNFSVTNNPGPASIMTANAGTTPQSATINTAFANALAVTVTDAHNNPVSGVAIQFTAPGSGASGLFSNSSTQFQPMTNASGVATAPFTANGIAGGPYSVTAAASGLTQLSFSLTNLTGAVASITANAGTTPQSATVNTAFANALAVTVKDAGTNPISGANVVFTAPSTGASGTFSNSTNTITVPTNGLGVASAPFTANGTAGGSYSVSAMVGGLAASFSLTNTAVVAISPTVVSYSVQWGAETYNVIGTPRNRLPWQITGIQVVFSEPITTGNVNSLTGTGITTTGFSGLGTNTLTWTITPIALGNFPTVLAGSGANALKDMNGNALANGAGYNQNLKILYGDFNDDGVVNAQDLELVGIAMSAPYNLFADLNGDGVVNIADYSIVRSRLGTSLP